MAKYWKAWKEQIATSSEPSPLETIPVATEADSPTRSANDNGGGAVAAVAQVVPAAGAA
jgi:hypothetical protein